MISFRSFYYVFVLSLISISCQQQPDNYDDCILQNLKEDMNEAATEAVINACRKKFPKKRSFNSSNNLTSTRSLNKNELENLDGRAGLSFGNLYQGTIYNGNEEITVTDLEIEVTTTIGGKKSSKVYTTSTYILPKKTSNFNFNIITGDKGSDYSWKILGAQGKY